jgi:hypothetical protein
MNKENQKLDDFCLLWEGPLGINCMQSGPNLINLIRHRLKVFYIIIGIFDGQFPEKLTELVKKLFNNKN